jgi:hypothetical protein
MTFGKPLALITLLFLLATEQTREVVLASLSDAYFQVSVFVAATLLGLFFLEQVGRYRLEDIIRRHGSWQVFYGALLGAIPGCGGAIIVVTQYVRRSMSFGGVVATLTATMGDAAFLLLAKTPMVAITIFAICFFSGLAFGYLVDWVHGRDFMRVPVKACGEEEEIEENVLLSPFYRIWMWLFVPGAVVGLLYAAQFAPSDVLPIGQIDGWVYSFGAACALVAIVMWTFNPLSDIRLCISERRILSHRVVDTTNFITFWVICGFVGYGLLESVFDINLASLFDTWLYWLPLVAVFVGFVPGCGPQIVVTTLFLNGVIPLSAQIANAISNDGDALFPAVAIAPRAAVVATLYTAVPALLVGYAWFFLFE